MSASTWRYVYTCSSLFLRRRISTISLRAGPPITVLQIHASRRCSTFSKQKHETAQEEQPLRVLFCGSDHFSATSLKALHREHLADSNLVKSIDVVCKAPKKAGRGLKMIEPVPIKSVARELGLRTHEIDTFTNWEPPDNDPLDPINLIVVVSFGRLVPPRLLDSCLYGGINVHPSLLPMYRGAAPIHHSLLNGDAFTGVSVQTLHPKHFDHGEILLQSPEIPIAKGTTFRELHDYLAVIGAQLLVQTCHQRLFVRPIRPLSPPYQPSLAPKIDENVHCRLRWEEKAAEEVERYCSALNSLWGRFGAPNELDRRKRVIYSFIEIWTGESDEDVKPGTWKVVPLGYGTEALLVKCKKGWVRVGGIKIEGRQNRDGGEWGRSMIMSGKESLIFS